MCGIFGVIAPRKSTSSKQFEKYISSLLALSETRGQESAGIAVYTEEAIRVLKAAMRPRSFLKSAEYAAFVKTHLTAGSGDTYAVIGHSRLVTNGGQNVHENNHPVIADSLVGVHNGILVNDGALWAGNPDLRQTTSVDTEVLLRLTEREKAAGKPFAAAFREAARQIKGTFSVALGSGQDNGLLLATNNGSLYFAHHDSVLAFASEHSILAAFCRMAGWQNAAIRNVAANEAYLVSLQTIEMQPFRLDGGATPDGTPAQRVIEDKTPMAFRDAVGKSSVPTYAPVTISRFDIDPTPIRALRRCTRCVLPETVPFISFDDHGVCNFCNHHVPRVYKGREALQQAAEAMKRHSGHADCLFTFSGGRDSSFGLHYAVKELGLKPVTYTYDWGLITDLARRNQARMCGALGVEHIVVSADIARKRDNVRRNVLAWLKRPHLGMIPLFMAGDKQYFYFANKIASDLGLNTIMLASNPLEKTHFKAGFCGVPPVLGHRPKVTDQARMLSFYAGQVLTNPAYINRSLTDTLGAFSSYYVIKHQYLRLFDYIPWVEADVDNTLINTYDWETATDTRSTWRIGDGTAAFYNYIYYAVAGFTENDTFRSNQIREGVLTREEAMAKVETENAPRMDSLGWYCTTIGLDPVATLGRIRSMPTLYRR